MSIRVCYSSFNVINSLIYNIQDCDKALNELNEKFAARDKAPRSIIVGALYIGHLEFAKIVTLNIRQKSVELIPKYQLFYQFQTQILCEERLKKQKMIPPSIMRIIGMYMTKF